MIWPPQLPGLSPIVYLCDELDKNIKKLLPKSEKEMWQKLKSEWHKIDFQIRK